MTRKATALPAHLALAEHPRDRARSALRRTLSTLRKGVDEEWMAMAGDSASLQPGPGLSLVVERCRALAGASPEPLSQPSRLRRRPPPRNRAARMRPSLAVRVA